MKNKIAKSNGILYKIRNFLDRKTLSHLYNSFVFPYLIYGIEVWGNTNAVHLDPIIKIQKKIVRTITFSHYFAHTEPIFDTLNILNFNNFVVHSRLAPMWQQSGALLFCSCHGIAGFLVDELQIWIWRHFLEVLPDMTLIFIFKKEYIIFVKYVL